MTKYHVPFLEKSIKVYRVEATSKLDAALKVGAMRERGELPVAQHSQSTKMLAISTAIDDLPDESTTTERELEVVPPLTDNEYAQIVAVGELEIDGGPLIITEDFDGASANETAPQLTPPRHT